MFSHSDSEWTWYHLLFRQKNTRFVRRVEKTWVLLWSLQVYKPTRHWDLPNSFVCIRLDYYSKRRLKTLVKRWQRLVSMSTTIYFLYFKIQIEKGTWQKLITVSRTFQIFCNQNLTIIKKGTWQKPVNVSRTIHLHHSAVSAWNEPCDPWRRMSRIWPSITIRVHASHLYD